MQCGRDVDERGMKERRRRRGQPRRTTRLRREKTHCRIVRRTADHERPDYLSTKITLVCVLFAGAHRVRWSAFLCGNFSAADYAVDSERHVSAAWLTESASSECMVNRRRRSYDEVEQYSTKRNKPGTRPRLVPGLFRVAVTRELLNRF